MEYMKNNLIKHGLVDKVVNWEYLSFVKRGVCSVKYSAEANYQNTYEEKIKIKNS